MINGHTDFTFTDATWVVEQAKAGASARSQ
jgi:hypothetical protein